jgi:hypothetical protein
MIKMATESMKNMRPEDLEAINRMVQQPGGHVPHVGSMGGAQTSGGAGVGVTGMPEMTPEMIKMATESMKNMKPEDMEAMRKMVGQQGGHMGPMGGAGMPQMTPDMIKMATESMKNMKPEDLEAMRKMVGGPAAAAGVPTGGSMEDAMKVMQVRFTNVWCVEKHSSRWTMW